MRARTRSILVGVATFLTLCPIISKADTYTQQTSSNIGQLSSETKTSAPDGTTGNDRTQIGLGEVVEVSLDPDSWSDTDCNVTQSRIETDTIGDCLWACADTGSITPATGYTVTLTAGYTEAACVVGVDVYDSQTKFSDGYLYRQKAFNIIKPTGETTVFDAWNGPRAGFESTLQPTTVCFAAINVEEHDGTGSSDGCWFSGSAQSKFEALTGGNWPVGNDNKWGNDWLGWGSSDISYYRIYPTGAPSAPCNTSLAQEMHVDTPSYDQYAGGNLVLTIGTTTVQNARNGANAQKTYP